MAIKSGQVKIEYIHSQTRNPFRIARACWRLVKDLGATKEATIIESQFMRSKWFKKYAGWERAADRLMPGEHTQEILDQLPRLPNLDLEELLKNCSPGTVGYVVATHMKCCGLNSNIFRPANVRTREEYLAAHLTETHDIWHVVSGFGNDEPGEIGVVAFYCAQTGLPIFILLLAIALLNTALYSHDKVGERFDAISEGWRAGKRAQPLYGINWEEQWQRPINELRQELRLPETVSAGVGIFEVAA
jgi:ubiquinone biosynthesis protein COQ4